MKGHIFKVVAAMLWMFCHAAYAGTHHYYYTDPQGTVLAKADAGGTIIASYDYAPYGAAVASMSPAPSGPGYTGHVNDPDSGLVYMQARFYDPVLGRFLSVDSVAPSAGSLSGFNRYAYANNNPIVNMDPDGRQSTDDICMGNAQCEGGGGDPYAGHFYAQDQIASAMQESGAQDQQSTNGSSPTGSSSHFSSTLIATMTITMIVGGGPEDPLADIAVAIEDVAAGSAEVLPAVVSGTSEVAAEATPSAFWSGGDAARAAAEDWAAANGGATLEMTAEGQATEAATQGADWLTEARPAWVSASRNFANSAAGDVHVFQSGVVSTQSVWATTEYPALMANPNVARIIYHGVGW